MPAIQSALPFRARHGVTLLELLVVLVVMAIAAAVVIPVLEAPVVSRADEPATLVTKARRAAIARGEPVRLRIAGDGVWALVSLREGVPIGNGRIVSANDVARSHDETATFDIRIDAMGSCTPSPTSNGSSAATPRFDPVSCRFVRERS